MSHSPNQVRPQLEQLEDRQLLASHLMFNGATHVVDAIGTRRHETLVISKAPANTVRIRLTGGAHGTLVLPRSVVGEVVLFTEGGHDSIINRTNVAATAVSSAPVLDTAATTDANGLTPAEEQVFNAVNAFRTSHHLAPLTINPLLQQMAHNLASEEAALNEWGDGDRNGHILFGHDMIWRAAQVGYHWSYLGENAADNWGYRNPVPMLIQQWWNSPEHRANILDPKYTETGIGVATSRQGKTMGVEDFGRP